MWLFIIHVEERNILVVFSGSGGQFLFSISTSLKQTESMVDSRPAGLIVFSRPNWFYIFSYKHRVRGFWSHSITRVWARVCAHNFLFLHEIRLPRYSIIYGNRMTLTTTKLKLRQNNFRLRYDTRAKQIPAHRIVIYLFRVNVPNCSFSL